MENYDYPEHWPPSRGPRPEVTKKVNLPAVEREEVYSEQDEGDAQERAMIEALIDGTLEDRFRTRSVYLLPDDKPLDDLSLDEEDQGKRISVLKDGEIPEFDRDDVVYIRRVRAQRPEPLCGNFFCYLHLDTLASLTLEQADRMTTLVHVEEEEIKDPNTNWTDFQPRSIETTLSYPFMRSVKLTIQPYEIEFTRGEESWKRSNIMTAGYFLWTIARTYRDIYARHEHFGVWGHALDDLYFEGVVIDSDGIAEVLLGS